jgi:hypothetical protein
MLREDDGRPIRKAKKCYYSDEHGYVCDCRRSLDDYETLCWSCKEYVDNQREEEDNDDDT